MSEVRGNMSRRRDLTGNVQLVGNMVTEVSESSTDSQYPSAKAVEERNKKTEPLLLRGAPYNTTKGAVGQLAIDTYTGYNHVYKCVAVNEDGTYTWENIDHPSQNNFYIKDIDMEWGTADGYGDEYENIGVGGGLKYGEKYEVKLEMFLNNEVVFTTESWYKKSMGICIYDPVSEVELCTIYDEKFVIDDVELLDIEHDAWKITLKGVGWVYALEYNTELDGYYIKADSIRYKSLHSHVKFSLADYYNKNGNIKTIGNLSSGEQEGSLYTSDAIPDNLGLGAFAGGFKGQATADYSATAGYGSVVGVRGYKVEKLTVTTHPLVYTLKLSTLKNDDTNESACPQIAVGAKFRLLRKFCGEDATCPDEEKTWYLTGTGTIDTINEETNEITISPGRKFSPNDNIYDWWTAENAPLLVLDIAELPNSPWKVLSDEYAEKCLGDVFCFGPDAYPLTSEQITDLTAEGIKVGSGSRGISTGHFGTVSGKYGFSYNNRGRSIGESSKCGGQECWARAGGSDVHGLQCQTMPDARHSFTRGGYNIVYGAFAASLGIGNHVYTLGGLGRGTYGEKDTAGRYLDFIGIGSDDSNRQNGYTFDKQGNVWFKGSIKFGGTSFDDEDASTVATLADIDNIMAEIIEVQKAIVGGEL